MKALFSSKEAAAYLGYSNPSMVQSRVTGVLSGIPAPEHIKIGKTVKYKKESLDSWISGAKELSEG